VKELIDLLKLTRAHTGMYCTAVVALIAGSLAFLFIPSQLGRLVASLQPIAAGGGAREAANAVFASAALLSTYGVASLVYTFLVSLVSERIVNDLRQRFFCNLLEQRLDKQTPKALGEIASEFSSDLSLVQNGLSTTLTDCIRHALVTVGATAALFLIHFQMTVLALLGIFCVAGVVIVFIRRATASMLAVQQYRAKLMALLLEAAANAYIIQAYGRTSWMSGRFASSLNETFTRIWRQLLLMASMNPVCLAVFALVMAALGMYGVQELRSAHLSLAQLISYFTFAALMVASVSQVGHLATRLRQAGAIVAKHRHMLTASELSVEPTHTEKPRKATGTAKRPYGFDVRNVSFTYPGKGAPAVSDVSFVVPPGKITAIVGESGGGKSTLAAMLCGLYEPQHGSVQILDSEGTAVDMELAGLETQIAIVPQEPFLFAGTVVENITFGRNEISVTDARRAATAARIHDFITSLPAGYDTQIQEAGKNLSRGQRQRIAIARALAGRPSVIILDEATASLDVVSERAIKALIDELRGGVTFVIIAHQGALLSDVDHRVLLKSGKIVSDGQPSVLQAAASEVLC
jgi:ATP-binding cassette subfamily B protein